MMTQVRCASYSDIPAIGAMCEGLFKASRYNRPDWALDADLLYATLFQIVAAGSEPRLGGQVMFVAVDADKAICGFIIGGIGATYHVLSEATVADNIWHTVKGAPPDAARALMAKLHAWAASGGVRRQAHFITDTGTVDPKAVMRLLRRDGFRLTGYIMEREIEI